MTGIEGVAGALSRHGIRLRQWERATGCAENTCPCSLWAGPEGVGRLKEPGSCRLKPSGYKADEYAYAIDLVNRSSPGQRV
jgi:hypothetical protein